MPKPADTLRSHCPINFGLETFGDRWTLLVLRDLLLKGKCSFKEFQASEEGISTNILAERLERLAVQGLITSERSETDSRQINYHPTAKCSALIPVLLEMAYWGAKYDPKTAAPPSFARAYEKDRSALLKSMREPHEASKR